ncbi:sensor histidine kinase [Paenibacillus lautus]|uniref:sensor histidine kinase n=1 Tax=Paenibacillus lautus TaxID=1401 RepID=UPI002DB77BC4|nr:sensor histidine kinase [Paenibacillus lautus]MEC0253847.1 sensor histidine kinase [Paenibacillus lautus]
MNILLRFFNKFHSLQWKLTLSYIFITMIVLILIQFFAILIYFGVVHYNANQVLAGKVSILAQNMSVNFNGSLIDRDQVQVALKGWNEEEGIEFLGYSALIDPNKSIIAAAGEQAPNANESKLDLPPILDKYINELFAGDPQADMNFGSYIHKEKDIVYAASPIAKQKAVLGVIMIRAENLQISPWAILPSFFQSFGQLLIMFLAGSATVGIAFGMVTSRGLVRRIRKILKSSDRWRHGDFTTSVTDSSRDELGQLSHRLNQMAKELQLLVRTRQELATWEERNRMARDLHDSVKQQLFAVSIWVNTSKSLIGRDDDTARSHLSEAETLISLTQRELNALIHELRPAALEGIDLAHALEDYAHTWQQQTGIVVNYDVHNSRPVSPMIEEAFYRIAQEALSNIARHGEATAVKLVLDCGEFVSLTICDNGKGFDVKQADGQGVGLSSIRERARNIGGQVDISSVMGTGTIVTIQCKQGES